MPNYTEPLNLTYRSAQTNTDVTKQIWRINTGIVPGDLTGDPLPVGGEKINTAVAEIIAAINSLNQIGQNSASAITALQSAVNNLQSAVSNLQTTLTSTGQNVGDINNQITIINNQISQILNAIDALNQAGGSSQIIIQINDYIRNLLTILLPAGTLNRPEFVSYANRGVRFQNGVELSAPGHHDFGFIPPNFTILLPALDSSASVVSRYDYIQAGVVKIFDHTQNPTNYRSVWFLVASPNQPITAQDIVTLLTDDNEVKFTANNSAAGQPIGNARFYFADPSLTNSTTYTCNPSSLVLVPILRVWRVQNYNIHGYHWYLTGEPNEFNPTYQLQPTYFYVGPGWQDWNNRCRETLRRILLGLPLPNVHSYHRYVYNLLTGTVAANQNAPGISAVSPNGAQALTNNQRISFTNQAISSTLFCLPYVTTNSSGQARAEVTLSTLTPPGTIFSPDPLDHKIISSAGDDVTAEGSFTGLGTSGTLVWTANTNSSVTPGQTVYIIPAIEYPAGSGLPNTWVEVEAVYLNAAPLHQNNVREAPEDLTAYTEPANGEQYIVVVGKERAALHYIYRKLTLTADANGVVRIPNTARGLIAFLSGPNAPTNRINKAVVTGLTANETYQALVYHPPQSTEQWQIQVRASGYAGTQERLQVDNSFVVSQPIVFAHSQGGGNSAFQDYGEYRHEAVGFRLPTSFNGTQNYALDTSVVYAHEYYSGTLTFRELSYGYETSNLPVFGMTIAAPAGGSFQGRGFSAVLSSTNPLNILKYPTFSGLPYQIGIAFVVSKGMQYRLVVCTSNAGQPFQTSIINLSSNENTAIDTFHLY